jgi:CheY-like chemotaxis protein
MLRTILVVDDSAMIRRIVGQLIKKAGFRVILAENGAAGYKQAKQFLPDLIIMDVEMPEMDGISATKKIKADSATSSIPVMFFTSLGSEENIAEAKKAGGIGFLNKPICQQELEEEIKKILG